jgi:hypothetical protein
MMNRQHAFFKKSTHLDSVSEGTAHLGVNMLPSRFAAAQQI